MVSEKKMNEQLINLLEMEQPDELIVKDFLKERSVKELFQEYKKLNLTMKSCQKLDALKLLVEERG